MKTWLPLVLTLWAIPMATTHAMASANSSVTTATVKKDLYRCEATSSTGFNNDSGKWHPVTFNNPSSYLVYYARYDTDEYYFVNRTNNGGGNVGSQPTQERDGFMISFDTGSHLTDFQLNLRNLRFSYVSQKGYVDGSASLTPYMEIGKCSPL